RKKSYHSSAVPTNAPNATLRASASVTVTAISLLLVVVRLFGANLLRADFRADLLRADLLRAVHAPPADERREHLHLADPLRCDGRDVVGEQHEVGELARGEAAALALLARDPGGVEGVGAQRGRGVDALG